MLPWLGNINDINNPYNLNSDESQITEAMNLAWAQHEIVGGEAESSGGGWRRPATHACAADPSATAPHTRRARAANADVAGGGRRGQPHRPVQDLLD